MLRVLMEKVDVLQEQVSKVNRKSETLRKNQRGGWKARYHNRNGAGLRRAHEQPGQGPGKCQ